MAGTAVRQNAPKDGRLSGNQQRAAWLVAEDEKNLDAIALECGIHPRTLDKWIARPEFAGRVHEIRAELAANLSRYRIARKDRRIAALDDRWERQQRIIAERAEDPDMEHIPGGTTGMVVRTYKMLGAGTPDARLVEEYGYDTGLDGSMRATEVQASKESGQWTEKTEVSGEMIVRRYPGTSPDDL